MEKDIKTFCSKCSNSTNHQILSEKEVKYFEEETGWWDETSYQIIQCKGCDEVSFRKRYNDISIQQGSDNDEAVEELYPHRSASSRTIKKFPNLPVEIKTIYRETIDAFNNNLTLLCSVGVRAILEGICLDKSITEGIVTTSGKTRKSKNLDGKISGLAAKGFLTIDNAEYLHELRFLGNEAVHELAKPGIEELRLALDIIELVIDNIYEISHKALKLKTSRANRRAGGGKGSSYSIT